MAKHFKCHQNDIKTTREICTKMAKMIWDDTKMTSEWHYNSEFIKTFHKNDTKMT